MMATSGRLALVAALLVLATSAVLSTAPAGDGVLAADVSTLGLRWTSISFPMIRRDGAEP